jgi:SSS family solute:Na+ symporter
LDVASKALVVVMGLGKEAVPLVAAIAGAVAIIYTTLGGMRAVVVTDVIQSCLLFGGAILAVSIITVKSGGLTWWPSSWPVNWDPQPFFSFDPHVRVTIVGTLMHAIIWTVSTAGGDQTSVQRFMSTRDARSARHSFLVNVLCQLLITLVIAALGLSLLGYFSANPHLLPDGINSANDADSIFPHFIAHNLPVGAAGLVVAALFAAAMSSIDSGVNSITAVVMTDILDRFNYKPRTERAQTRLAMILALGIGVFVVVGSSCIENVPGNFMALTYKIANLFVSPLFTLFFMALLWDQPGAKQVNSAVQVTRTEYA